MTKPNMTLSSTDPSSPSREGARATAEPERKLDLSLAQVTGGALAAMTAAALGSRLGVGGTIVGAAFASVVAGVAGTLYTESLRRTHRTVKTAWTGRGVSARPDLSTVDPAEVASVAPDGRRRRPWTRFVVGALAVFGMSAVLVTGFELVSGHAMSGGQGTTITQASDSGPSSRDDKPAGSRTDEPSPTETPSEESTPTEEPTPSDGATPSEEPTPSAEASPSDGASSSSEPAPSDPASSSSAPTEAPSEGRSEAPQGGPSASAPDTDPSG